MNPSATLPPIAISAIEGAKFIITEDLVLFDCTNPRGSFSLELPSKLLPRFIGLCLHLAGRISDDQGHAAVVLELREWTVENLNDESLAIEFIMPGGSPLMFGLKHEDAQALALALFKALPTPPPSTSQ